MNNNLIRGGSFFLLPFPKPLPVRFPISKKTGLEVYFSMERVTGIEPVSDAWEASIIATIRYPRDQNRTSNHELRITL